MEVIYHIKESEFDQNIFKAIKAAFKNKLMKISISAEGVNGVAVEKGNEYAVAVSYDDFSKIVDSFEENESFDLMSSLKKFKAK
jgi:hypothetical protein